MDQGPAPARAIVPSSAALLLIAGIPRIMPREVRPCNVKVWRKPLTVFIGLTLQEEFPFLLWSPST